MPYYCLECEKEHANNYKKHWKYRRQPLIKKKIELADLEKVIDDIREIKNTLGLWANFIQRKDPYWKGDKD